MMLPTFRRKILSSFLLVVAVFGIFGAIMIVRPFFNTELMAHLPVLKAMRWPFREFVQFRQTEPDGHDVRGLSLRPMTVGGGDAEEAAFRNGGQRRERIGVIDIVADICVQDHLNRSCWRRLRMNGFCRTGNG